MSGHPETEIVAYVRDELPPPEAERLEEHLEGCAACRAAVAEVRHILGVLRVAPPPVNWAGYGAEVRARLQARRGPVIPSRGWRPVPLALAAGLAAVALVTGLQLAPERGNGDLAMLEPVIAHRLPLLEEYRIVERLDLLEDLDVIRHLDQLLPDAS